MSRPESGDERLSLRDRTAVVTGAGGDIGAAICRRLAAREARILAVDVDEAAAERTVQAVRRYDVAAAAFRADVGDEGDVAAMMAAGVALSGTGAVDMLVNNAGVEGPAELLEDYPTSAFERVLRVNTIGVFLGLKHGLRVLRDGGAVVNVASVAGVTGSLRMSGYVASKHAVIGLTRTAALEAAPRGIRVNAVCPGAVDGRMMGAIDHALGRPHSTERIPLGRYAAPDHVAAMVAFLLSADAAHVTGGIHMVDGGQRAR